MSKESTTDRLALIDADSIVYIVGFGKDGDTLSNQCKEIDVFIEDIMTESKCTEYLGFLTGSNNWRDQRATIQPYKGNRDKLQRPEFYNELRDYMINAYGFILVHGEEADDVVARYHMDLTAETVICLIDKDLDTVPGEHYNFKKRERYWLSEYEANIQYYLQVLTGDYGDNIPGLFKITGKKASKKIKEGLYQCLSPEEMDTYCLNVYKSASEGVDIEEAYNEIKDLLKMGGPNGKCIEGEGISKDSGVVETPEVEKEVSEQEGT